MRFSEFSGVSILFPHPVYRDKSLRGVAKTYNISVMTLKWYVRKKREAIDTGSVSPRYEPDYKEAQVFT